MAKKRRREPQASARPEGTIDGVPYEVHDAFHTLRRAREMIGDKKLMKQVSEHAKTLAEENRRVGEHAAMLARSGKISPDQMKKLSRKRPGA